MMVFLLVFMGQNGEKWVKTGCFTGGKGAKKGWKTVANGRGWGLNGLKMNGYGVGVHFVHFVHRGRLGGNGVGAAMRDVVYLGRSMWVRS